MLEKLILAALITLSLHLHLGWKWTFDHRFGLLSITPNTETVEVFTSQFLDLD
ncbi:hypothetical protein N39L_39310 [Limnospira platensis NIES-39]|jgi:hypothetical protein|uniref:Uncharacterized protein n=1 Tax=Limnospira platensis NIES-46 TaxID=1236695 RepID=A0A5M3T5P5_LIMPL|nr:hypothetical protein N39L_39310 [Arthrospira platensis NIES-39]GCE94794.1 hypothetical protein NIES46_28540 [Arthrospira platensis NIES-46]